MNSEYLYKIVVHCSHYTRVLKYSIKTLNKYTYNNVNIFISERSLKPPCALYHAVEILYVGGTGRSLPPGSLLQFHII